jgi:uncharacterized protein (TIGR02246 family)
MRNGFGLTICLMIFAAGCSQAPTPAPAPPDTRAADEKALRDGETAWVSDWTAKDPEKIASHYADDATLMVPDMPAAKGKEEIRKALKMITDDPKASLQFTTASAEVAKSGDIGYTQGTYTMMYTDPKTKKVLHEKGKYVTVYKRQADGSWKAIEDINNADAAAEPMK